MKTSLRAVLRKNVGTASFILACLLLASVVLAAKVMTDRVIAVQDSTYRMLAGLAPVD